MTYITISENSYNDIHNRMLDKYTKTLVYPGIGNKELLDEYYKEMNKKNLEENDLRFRSGTRMVNKRKAELIPEGMELLKNMGANSGWILNITHSAGCGTDYLYVSQSWYLLKEDDKWYFKMDKKYKAKHLIE